MKSYDIKRVIEKLEPDPEIKSRLAEAIAKKRRRRDALLPIAVIAASLFLIIGTGIFADYKLNNNHPSIKNSNDNMDGLIALLPDSDTAQDPKVRQQNGSSENSSAPPSDNKSDNKSGNQSSQHPKSQNNQDDSKRSSLPLPDRQATQSPEPKHQDNQNTGSANSAIMPSDSKSGQNDLRAQLAQGGNDQNQGIYIPKAQIPENLTPTAKMAGIIIYQNRIYLQNPSPLDWNCAAKLIDQKLGITRETISGQSDQDDYNGELASTIGIQNVYTVKGYDPDFRIMTYDSNNKDYGPYFFDCLNNITVSTGQDIFSKFKIENNISSVQYENCGSGNNGEENYRIAAHLNELDNFLAALENSIPQKGVDNLSSEENSVHQKVITLKLNDGSQVQLKLFKEGYVSYNGLNILFKVDDFSFINFWDTLD